MLQTESSATLAIITFNFDDSDLLRGKYRNYLESGCRRIGSPDEIANGRRGYGIDFAVEACGHTQPKFGGR